MNKKFELLRQAVNTYKVNHCDGNKNEKELLEFIEELERLTIPTVINRRGLLVAFNKEMAELHTWFLPAEDSMIDEFLSNQ
jgi:hypothetical protein